MTEQERIEHKNLFKATKIQNLQASYRFTVVN